MRLSRVLLGIGVLVACGGGIAGSLATQGSGPLSPTAAQNERHFKTVAKQVADEWDRSTASAIWRDRLILLSDPVIHATGADIDWVYRLPARVPAPPKSAPVRFVDGTSMMVSLRAADDAIRMVAPDPHGQPAQITRVALGTARFLTNRGMATVPAWRFSVDGLPEPIIVAAVEPSDLADRPYNRQPIPVPLGLEAPGEQRPVDTGSVTVLVNGACDHSALLVYETDTVVVVGVSRPTAPITKRVGTCGPTPYPGFSTLTAPLSRPLGARALLDVAGYPMITTNPYLRGLNT